MRYRPGCSSDAEIFDAKVLMRKLQYLSLAAALLAVATVLFLLRKQEPGVAAALPPASHHTAVDDNPLARRFSTGNKPLVEVQAQVLRDCPREELERCEQKFWDDLGRYWGVDSATARAWHADVKAHEENLRQWQQTGSNMNERFQTLWQAHQQALGKERALQVYGRQKALADFSLRTGQLLQDAATLAPDERVRAWEAMTRETFGPYDEELRQQLGPHQLYHTEIQLRAENGVLAESERQRLREKYFSPEAAQQLAAREQQETRQASVVATYQTALKALNERYRNQPGFPDLPAYRQELETLRQTAF